MNQPEIIAAVISAGGTVLAAMIGGLSVLVVALHRKAVIDLARSVEAYYAMETEWIRRMLAEEGNTEPTENQIRNRRGKLRRELLGDELPESLLTARNAKRIRARYFSND